MDRPADQMNHTIKSMTNNNIYDYLTLYHVRHIFATAYLALIY